jgi:hypothetical protein
MYLSAGVLTCIRPLDIGVNIDIRPGLAWVRVRSLVVVHIVLMVVVEMRHPVLLVSGAEAGAEGMNCCYW